MASKYPSNASGGCATSAWKKAMLGIPAFRAALQAVSTMPRDRSAATTSPSGSSRASLNAEPPGPTEGSNTRARGDRGRINSTTSSMMGSENGRTTAS